MGRLTLQCPRRGTESGDMIAKVLTPAKASPQIAAQRIAAAATTGLWRAMTDRFRPAGALPTVEVVNLAPRQSMFDYDPSQAVLLADLPDELL